MILLMQTNSIKLYMLSLINTPLQQRVICYSIMFMVVKMQ
jgi:hypothetical protein